MVSEEKNFKNQPIRNKSRLWQSCLLMDQDEMSNLYRGPSIDASYQVPVAVMFVNGSGRNEQSLQRTFHRCFLPSFGSFGLAVSEEKILKNKNCLWWPCLLMDRDEMSNLYRGPPIDASYQVSVNLAEGFLRRRLKCEKLNDNRRRMPSDGKNSHCFWQGELKSKNSMGNKTL
jgi:hypothetical protein